MMIVINALLSLGIMIVQILILRSFRDVWKAIHAWGESMSEVWKASAAQSRMNVNLTGRLIALEQTVAELKAEKEASH